MFYYLNRRSAAKLQINRVTTKQSESYLRKTLRCNPRIIKLSERSKVNYKLVTC